MTTARLLSAAWLAALLPFVQASASNAPLSESEICPIGTKWSGPATKQEAEDYRAAARDVDRLVSLIETNVVGHGGGLAGLILSEGRAIEAKVASAFLVAIERVVAAQLREALACNDAPIDLSGTGDFDDRCSVAFRKALDLLG